MNTTNQNTCRCTECVGAECRCGCQTPAVATPGCTCGCQDGKPCGCEPR